jgi:hypothetical protein
MLDGESLCHAGTSLQDAIDRADFVVFFGHGETDHWVAVPAGAAGKDLPLVETTSVSLLSGRQVYAACCHSLAGLGTAFAAAFPSLHGKPEFVGYSAAFDFSVAQRDEFRRVVHGSVRDFILGSKTAATIVNDQRTAWLGLETAFKPGGLYNALPDAIFAASCASSNALAVGHA